TLPNFATPRRGNFATPDRIKSDRWFQNAEGVPHSRDTKGLVVSQAQGQTREESSADVEALTPEYSGQGPTPSPHPSALQCSPGELHPPSSAERRPIARAVQELEARVMAAGGRPALSRPRSELTVVKELSPIRDAPGRQLSVRILDTGRGRRLDV